MLSPASPGWAGRLAYTTLAIGIASIAISLAAIGWMLATWPA